MTRDEIREYAETIGEDLEVEAGLLTSSDDIRYWYENKVRNEGPPPDEDLIREICDNGISRPVIIDPQAEYTVEGRHRLAAALRCGLAVPVMFVTRKRS